MDKLRTYSSLNKRFNVKGMIDYRILLFIAIYACIIYQILDVLNVHIVKIIYILVLSLIPMFGVYFTVSKEENITEVLLNIFKYLVKIKMYVFRYEDNSMDKHKIKYKKYSCKNK